MPNYFAELSDAIEKSGKSYDTEGIRRAYETAESAHGGQDRDSGEPYITHPVAVALILVELGMDSETIMAALLHDVVEDTGMPLSELRKQFGEPVAALVDGVTKLTKLSFSTKEEQQAENIRKMLLAMAEDIRVIIIKLADRLHNMRTIGYREEWKQRSTALETMEVYAPLAHRLGIYTMKEELEDLAIIHLDPIAYKEIRSHLAMEKDERQAFLDSIQEKLLARIKPEYPNVSIEGRVKSLFGVYRKVYMDGRAFDEIYDVYAVRVIVDSVNECYNILGIIHDMFTPIPNRFKDYISTPKPNMYQSLQTTVIDKGNKPFEVQIRTWDMHHTAEYGIAAHWKYKAGISGQNDRLDERLQWVRKLLETQMDAEDSQDILRAIKTDLAPDEVYVFTPKGDVKSLPNGSTVIDYAYAIHTEVGNKMIGAKVDGRIVSIDYKVKTGNIVEILTTNSESHGPNRDWLNIVRTSEARNKIRGWFKKERREENILEGRTELEREFKRNHIELGSDDFREFVDDIARRQHFASADDFYAAIGYGGTTLSKIMPRIKDDYQKQYKLDEATRLEQALQRPKKEKRASSGVIVEGLDECLVKFARCCNPLPGDDIVGFITRGYGVSIHKADCVNVQIAQESQSQVERWVHAEWEETIKESYKSSIEIYALDRSGLLADVSIALANLRVPIHSLNAREVHDGHTQIQITMGLNNVGQLEDILGTFRRISGVIFADRTQQ